MATVSPRWVVLAAGLTACESAPPERPDDERWDEGDADSDTQPDDDAPPEETCGELFALVNHLAWTATSEAEDPFGPPEATATHQPELCPITEISLGVQFAMVDTSHCSWITLEQPAFGEAAAGETLSMRMWFYSPAVFEPAQATLILALDDEPLITEILALPESAGRDINATAVLPRAVGPSTKIRWHVANHGVNMWMLKSVGITREVPCP